MFVFAYKGKIQVMAAISFFSLENDLSKYNYAEAMWGYSLCSFEVFPGQFNIHVADENDEIVASGTHEGNFGSMLVVLLAAFYNVAAKTHCRDFREFENKPTFADWLFINIEPRVSKGIPKQYLMTPDKVWKMYSDEMCPPKPHDWRKAPKPDGKTWREKVKSGEVRPCKDNFKPVEAPVIGRLYHLAWAEGGAVWRLQSINGKECVMVTPKTGRERIAMVKDLRMTRAEERANSQSE